MAVNHTVVAADRIPAVEVIAAVEVMAVDTAKGRHLGMSVTRSGKRQKDSQYETQHWKK